MLKVFGDHMPMIFINLFAILLLDNSLFMTRRFSHSPGYCVWRGDYWFPWEDVERRWHERQRLRYVEVRGGSILKSTRNLFKIWASSTPRVTNLPYYLNIQNYSSNSKLHEVYFSSLVCFTVSVYSHMIGKKYCLCKNCWDKISLNNQDRTVSIFWNVIKNISHV